MAKWLCFRSWCITARQIAMLLQANSGPSSEAAGTRDCILLQTGMDKTGRFQEAVGEAMAKTLKAGCHASCH